MTNKDTTFHSYLELLKLIKIESEEIWKEISSVILWDYLISMDELSYFSDKQKISLRIEIMEFKMLENEFD
jgi:hypothetical protein